MEDLYRRKGGAREMFNVTTVRLEREDLDALETAVITKALPYTEGFFFGRSDGSEEWDDRAFIRKARDALDNGFAVFYCPNW